MNHAVLQAAIAQVPPGRWAVGVSGGADSVALFCLLGDRTDLELTVVHLDHQTRGDAGRGDAAFVVNLAAAMNLPAIAATRSEIEPRLRNPPGNASALYRECRLEFFREVVRERSLSGVLLAHHADDQAETVLLRLLRGAGPAGLAGMSFRKLVGGLLICRPMLGVRRAVLREYLAERGQLFREDASNASDVYARNRVRKWLAQSPERTALLLAISKSSAGLKEWINANTPRLDESFRVDELADLPTILARPAAKRWLVTAGAMPGNLSPAVLDRLIQLCADASTPARATFPSRLTVRRRRQTIEAEKPPVESPKAR